MAKDKIQPQYEKQLKGWINELNRWGKDKFLWRYEEDCTEVYLFTHGNRYSIVARATYLGCQVSSRKPRPGEDWNRGNDLADGKFNEETWNRILRDIISYELKSISAYILNPPKSAVLAGATSQVY